MIELVFNLYVIAISLLFTASVIIDLKQKLSVEHRKYNTGDEIWLRNGKVIKIRTYDGLSWDESSPRIGSSLGGGGAIYP